MTAQELTAALVDVYARLRRGTVTDSAARREATGYFSSLRELAAGDRREKAGEKTTKKAQEKRVELCLLNADHAKEELVRLTPDLEPWEGQERAAQEARLTPEDVELLEVNAVARARRGEITEGTARAEAFVLKAIRYGLTLAPVAGGMTWRDYKNAVVERDREENAITIFKNEPEDQDEPFHGPVLTFIHGFPIAGETILVDHGGDPHEADAPPWPITYLGTITGYYVPKGWTRPQGEELAVLLKRLRTAGERACR